MKKIITLTIVVLLASTIFAQNGVKISETEGETADPSAILDVESSNKGILIPRMIQSDRDDILSPANGLTIYQTDGASGYYYYNGSEWLKIGQEIVLGTAAENTNGADIILTAQNGGSTTSSQTGGNIILTPGDGSAGGNDGIIELQGDAKISKIIQRYNDYYYNEMYITEDGFNLDVNAGQANAQGNIIFRSSSLGGGLNEKLRISSNGNVGIGTSNPLYKLNVEGNIMSQNNSGSYGHGGFICTQAGDNIGLTIKSTELSNFSARTWDIGSIVSTSVDYFVIRDITAEENRLTITEDGNVGIGSTTASQYKLDVAGTVNSTGGYLTNGADFAEYMENEEEMQVGDVVGLNPETGKVRKYQSGDMFAGIV